MVKADGRVFEWESPDNIRTDFLETFEFDSPNQYIKTIIEYYPEGGKCIELKSLKYYIVSFRNVGLFQEGVTKRIYHDLKDKLSADRLKVTTIYNTRGGFDTTCIEGEL